MRWAEIVLLIVGLWVAFAPASWGWDAVAEASGEGTVLRFFLGAALILLAGLLLEKNRRRRDIKQVLDGVRALNLVIGGGRETEHPEAVDLLIRSLSGGDDEVRRIASENLARLTGEDFGDDADAWEEWWRRTRWESRGPRKSTPE